MWDKVGGRVPPLYETLEWVTFALAVGAFLLALGGLSDGEGRLTSCAHPI